VHGIARIGFATRASRSRLTTLYQQAPLRVLFPRPPAGDPPHAVLVTTSGGVVGGDRLDVEIDVAPDAAALVTTQAAEKVYRSSGAEARLTVDLRAQPRAWLEWLPQETILFERARLRRRTTLKLGAQARAIAGDILVFGRRAHGERLRNGSLHDGWQVRIDGRLAWADALRLEGDIAAQLAAPFGLAGANATGTLLYVGPDAGSLLETMRNLLPRSDAELRVGVTCVPEVLITRWLSPDAARLRGSFSRTWTAFRHAVAGLPAIAPATWNC
jgi:urease accessory protein